MRPSWNWGVGITLTYLAFAGGTLGVVGYAMTQRVDLVSEDYYSRSLRQDDRMAATARADALGGRVSVALAEDRLSLDVHVPTAASPPPTGTITWYRPSDSRDDRSVAFRPVDGHQLVPLDGLVRGHWVVQVEWQSAGQTFYLERPVILP